MIESSDECSSSGLVCLVVDNFADGEFYRKLKTRFENQSKGKYLWLSNRFERRNYIPIEYSKDRFYIKRFLDVYRVNGDDRPWENIQPELLENDFEIVYKMYKVCCGVNWDHDPILSHIYEIHWRGFALEGVKRDGLTLKRMHNLNSDKQIVLEAIKQNEHAIQYVNKELLKDRSFVLEIVKENGMVLPLLSKHFQCDREVVLKSISNFPCIFKLVKEKLRSDRDFILHSVRENGRVMDFVPFQFLNDRELLLIAINQISNCPNYFKDPKQAALECVKKGACSIVLRIEEFCNDLDIVIESFIQNGCANNKMENEQCAISLLNKLFGILELIPQNMKNNKKVITEILTQTFDIVSYASKTNSKNSGITATLFSCLNNLLDETDIKEHKDLVLQVFRITGCLLLSGSPSFSVQQVISKFWRKSWESDAELMLEIVKCNYYFFLNLVKPDLKNNKTFMLQVLKLYPEALEHASIFLRNNSSFMLEAMKVFSIDIFEFETLLVEDRQFALEAVSFDGNNLEYLTDFDNDREVVLRAVENDGYSLKYASEEMCEDREIVLAAVRNCGSSLEFASYVLQQDREIVIEAIKNDPSALSFLCENFKWHDKQIVLEAVKSNYSLVPEEVIYYYRNDKEIVLEAVKYSIYALIHTSSKIRDDKDLIQLAVRTDPIAIRYASSRLKDDREIALMVVSVRGNFLEHLSDNMKNDRSVVLTAVRNMPSSIFFSSVNLLKDKEILLEALRNGLDSITFITHHSHINTDIDMFVEAIKRDNFGMCSVLKQLMKEEMKEYVAIKCGFCCRFNEDLFQKRIADAFLGALLV